MKIDGKLYELVYEYFEARILYGFYRYGDSLPSIVKIGSIFNMAPATVRMALSLLEKNGYVRVDAKRTAKVVYQAEPAQFRENAARYFASRKEGILDLTQSGKLLVEPLWEKGMGLWSDEGWELLQNGLTTNVPGAVSMPIKFYILILGTLKNRLVLNLFWEIIRYIRFPYLESIKTPPPIFPALKGQSRESVLSFLKQKFEAAYTRATGSLFAFIKEAQADYAMTDLAAVPFRWDIYRQRPQLRYTLACGVIRQIMYGQYPIGSYLPSLPHMAEQYGVGIDTVRRTLRILNSLGVTRSFHGVGTMVCMRPGPIDFNDTELREGIRLYRESLQLLALTIWPVSVYTLEAVGKDRRQALLKDYELMRANKKSYTCFEIFLSFVENECPLAVVRECYSKLLELQAFGYPIVLQRLKGYRVEDEYAAVGSWMEQALREDKITVFADVWKALLEQEETKLSQFMETATRE